MTNSPSNEPNVFFRKYLGSECSVSMSLWFYILHSVSCDVIIFRKKEMREVFLFHSIVFLFLPSFPMMFLRKPFALK